MTVARPTLPHLAGSDPARVTRYLADLRTQLTLLTTEVERRLLTLEGLLRAPVYTVATVPSAAVAGRVIYVSDESGGATLAFSDGADWRRVQDLVVVS